MEKSLLLRLQDLFGGPWGEHPEYLKSTWEYEVQNKETVLGYWDWVIDQMQNDDCSPVNAFHEYTVTLNATISARSHDEAADFLLTDIRDETLGPWEIDVTPCDQPGFELTVKTDGHF